MTSSLPAIIFDLDGTLTDSKPGILGCLRQVIDARNLGDCGPLDRFLGPPVEAWAVDLLPHATEEDHIAFAREYRSCYDREGWSNNSVFPGIRELLAQLRAQSFPLFVCTSKHQHHAVRILDKFDLSHFFTAIYGDKLEYQDHSKPMLLARLLADQSLSSDNAWMVGDRSFDFDAARANNVPTIAAAWGYGTQEEYATANALAPTPADILSLVLPVAESAVENHIKV
jgi:phosphoglycolate phosphatase